jgi:diaminohydroxyphosphoribosylaminopyrimidine deaminase/5-amino-6-(5-phosphoribosylamino)uracil reductase
VNLEPCCIFGNTPPCTDLIVGERIPKVVIAMQDPHPAVNGRGVQRLVSAGVEVVSGVLHESAARMNRRFTTFHQQKRPYVILKWAQSADGLIGKQGERVKISHALTDRLVHKWRSQEAAVMVGSETVRVDNPLLTARLFPGKNPLRVIASGNALPDHLEVFNADAETLVLQQQDPRDILQALHDRKVLSVLVEGGAKLLNSFISANLWDEARVIVSPVPLGNGIPAPRITGMSTSAEVVGPDKVILFVNG